MSDQSKTRRRYLWKHRRTRCRYCDVRLHWEPGRYILTVDHIIPLCRGGTNKRTNIAPACRECNTAKGPLTAEEFYKVREDIAALHALKESVFATVPKGYPERGKSWFMGERGIEFYPR